jgi:ferredoxin
MPIPTSRTNTSAEIFIDNEKCSGCGECVTVCKDYNLEIIDGKVRKSGRFIFGCIACGHCMMICPKEAIWIEGRCLSRNDAFTLPDKSETADYNALFSLLKHRRSIREFTDKPIDREIIDKIISAAQTAPMGIPPSDVHLLVFDSKEKVRNFTNDYSLYLKNIRWMASDWFLALMRPFWGKVTGDMMKSFIKPVFKIFSGGITGKPNLITYDAPLAIYFYGSPYADPADSLIAATYALLAGESLGLGTCMLGAIHPFIQKGKKAQKLREKWGIKYASSEGLFVIFGYSDVKYKRGVARSFASVDFVQ